VKDEAVVEELQKAVKRILRGRASSTLSPQERAGLVICTRVIMHNLDQYDYELQRKGWELIGDIGLNTWDQPPEKSSVELMHRSQN
jgi:hypothetical protein